MSDERKVFIGMMRPAVATLSQLSYTAGPVVCPRGHRRGHIAGGSPYTCHENGCYDTPVYATADEIIDRVATKILEGQINGEPRCETSSTR